MFSDGVNRPPKRNFRHTAQRVLRRHKCDALIKRKINMFALYEKKNYELLCDFLKLITKKISKKIN